MKYVRIQNCIFCNATTSDSKSVEHIIPESLGNESFILGKGVVCDKCNNYLSREVEKKVLELEGFKLIRFYTMTQSKKGKVPKGEVLIAGSKGILEWKTINGKPSLLITVDPEGLKNIITKKPKAFITKEAYLDDSEHSYEISRFLYKIAFEAIIYSFINYYEENMVEIDTILLDEKLKEIRDFVRIGNHNKKALPYLYKHGSMLNSSIGKIEIKFHENKDALLIDLIIGSSTFTVSI